MLREIKQGVNNLLQPFGWRLSRYNVRSDLNLQLLAAMSHVQTDLVFDIGANTGQFAQQLRSVGFAGNIVSFDPLTTAHAQLTAAAEASAPTAATQVLAKLCGALSAPLSLSTLCAPFSLLTACTSAAPLVHSLSPP